MDAWFESAFDELYLELYAHRDEAEAERAIGWAAAELARRGRGLAGTRWVDLGCGGGRHLAALAGRGARAVGLDRSLPLLERAHADARAAAGPERVVVAGGDLRRLPIRTAAFDGALSMFTSLGYFESEEENRAAFAEAARVVRRGGFFVVDFLNAAAIERDLVPASSRVRGPYRVEERRRIEAAGRRPEAGGGGAEAAGRRVVKEIRVARHPSGELLKQYVESVALWGRDELEERLAAAGFAARAAAGDYDGSPFTLHSPRLLIIGEREG